MKKYLFFAATALVALASCTDDNFAGDNSPNTSQSTPDAIAFSSGTKAFTRADHEGSDAAGLLSNNFVVEGVKGDGSTQTGVFDHYNVNWVTNTAHTTTSNTNDWEYVAQTKHAHASIAAQTIKYWDYTASQYDFIAYSKGTATAVYTGDPTATQVLYSAIDPSKMNGVDSNTDGKIDQGAYTIKGKAAELAKVYIADLVTAYRDLSFANDAAGDYNKVVQFKFRSLSAKVRVALYETVPGYSVKDVVFYTDASTPAADSKAHLFTTGSDVFNEEGTYIVYYPTTGSANKSQTDYNKAHLVFQPAASVGTSKDKSFDALDGTNTFVGEEVDEDGDGTLNETDKLFIGRSSDDASYAGDNAAHHYTVVIPNETGAALNLKVNYKLVSTDGSREEINVTGATAQVPAIYAQWKSGYAYTYIFKISKNTNGNTNPEAGPAGLYPITFDAVVTETEEGVQETITTVADPSITTYAKGAMVTANNEYLTGANIYVTVQGATLTTANAKLYTVTLADGAAQTINESSVANAIANGVWNGTSYTVTDANSKAMVVATAAAPTIVTEIAAADAPDGNAITVNAAKFTPAAAGTYVFEYVKTQPVYDSGSVLTASTSLKGYYTDAAGVKTRCADNTTADGTTTYYKQTTAGEYEYKIVKVVAAPAP